MTFLVSSEGRRSEVLMILSQPSDTLGMQVREEALAQAYEIGKKF